MLWVDKHRPKLLSKLTVHAELTQRLTALAGTKNLPHLIFYGPQGAGKQTRVQAVLRDVFGNGVDRVKVEHKVYKLNGKVVELDTYSSSYHIGLNPSDAGFQDRLVVQEVIKEIAESHPVASAVQIPYKVVVLHEVDNLSMDAQQALRRTMEKYIKTCRLILCCNNASKVIEPVRSRCVGIRVPAAEPLEIVEVLDSVAKQEGFKVPRELAGKIALKCNRNLRRAVLMLEAAKMKAYPFPADMEVEEPDWEYYITVVAQTIISEQSPTSILAVRGKLYELLGNCIPPTTILKVLLKEILKRVDDSLKPHVVEAAAYYEHRLQLGSKPIFHLEAFIVKVMAIYKRYIVEEMANFM